MQLGRAALSVLASRLTTLDLMEPIDSLQMLVAPPHSSTLKTLTLCLWRSAAFLADLTSFIPKALTRLPSLRHVSLFFARFSRRDSRNARLAVAALSPRDAIPQLTAVTVASSVDSRWISKRSARVTLFSWRVDTPLGVDSHRILPDGLEPEQFRSSQSQKRSPHPPPPPSRVCGRTI